MVSNNQQNDIEHCVRSSTTNTEALAQRGSPHHYSNSPSNSDLWSRTSRTPEIGNSSSLFSELFAAASPAPIFVPPNKENIQYLPVHTKKGKMVREVSPAKAQRLPGSSQDEPLRPLDSANISKPLRQPPGPVFGQTTKIESPLNRAAKDVFIQPKQRPEHHRPQVQPSKSFESQLYG